MKKSSMDVSVNLLDSIEMARFLNVKQSTIRQLCFKKKIPFLKVGRLVRFDLKEVMIWLKENQKMS